MYQQRQKNVSAMIFHMYQGVNGINTHLVHQRVRISSLRQSLYPVYDAIRWQHFPEIAVHHFKWSLSSDHR